MYIGINNNYTQFYKGIENSKQDVTIKDAMVKCDDDVMAEFSEDALRASKGEKGGTFAQRRSIG